MCRHSERLCVFNPSIFKVQFALKYQSMLPVISCKLKSEKMMNVMEILQQFLYLIFDT